MKSLAEIRANIKAQEEAQSGNSFSGDNLTYPHWLIKDNESTKIRFLPDANNDNPYGFYQEKLTINLAFPGIKGEAGSKAMVVKVPCMEQWEEVGSCPVLAEIRPWFKANDKDLEAIARKYWKKKSFFMSGFVIEKPAGFQEDENDQPEGLIRRFQFTPQIWEIAKAAIMDPELEDLPYDYDNGLDFVITKTPGSPHSSYATSKYVRKETALTQEQRDAIEEDGLLDLYSFLPKKPDDAHLAAIKEMFEASIDGELYDPEKWSKFYRPQGMQAPTTPKAENGDKSDDMEEAVKKTEADVITTTKKVEDVVEKEVEETAPAETTTTEENPGKANAMDILAKIRARPETS